MIDHKAINPCLQGPAVLPDNVTTTKQLIIHLVKEKLFEDQEAVYLFLRKKHAHQLTPKGRLWELADPNLDLRLHNSPIMDKVEYEDGALVLDWVADAENFAIALMDNGKEEMGSVLGMTPAVSCIDCSRLLLRPPETGWEDEQVCARVFVRVFADRSGGGAFRLRDRPYSRY